MFTKEQVSAFAVHLQVTGCFKTERDFNVMVQLLNNHFGLNYDEIVEDDEVHKTIQEVAYNSSIQKNLTSNVVVFKIDEGNKCQSCHRNEAKREHSCPYSEEIHGDYKSTCNCCDACHAKCSADI